VARRVWGWGVTRALLVTAGFLIVDLAFFGANLIKIAHGGWFPLLVAAVIYTVMTTWHTGRQLVTRTLSRSGRPIDAFLAQLATRPPVRVPGTAIFMTARDEGVPPILVHHLKHNKVLHEQVLLLTVSIADVPIVDPEHAIDVRDLGYGMYRVVAHYGFMQSPNVPAALEAARTRGLSIKEDSTYYLAHLTLFANDRIGMSTWRDKLFIVLARNARRATNFFRIPADCVVEIGIQLEL